MPQTRSIASNVFEGMPQRENIASNVFECMPQRENIASNTFEGMPQRETIASNTFEGMPYGENIASNTFEGMPQGENTGKQKKSALTTVHIVYYSAINRTITKRKNIMKIFNRIKARSIILAVGIMGLVSVSANINTDRWGKVFVSEGTTNPSHDNIITSPDRKSNYGSPQWNATYHYIEFCLLLKDDRGGGNNVWVQSGDVYIGGKHAFSIGGASGTNESKGDTWHNYRIIKVSDGNGKGSHQAHSATAASHSAYPSSFSPYWHTLKSDSNIWFSLDRYYERYHASFRWYLNDTLDVDRKAAYVEFRNVVLRTEKGSAGEFSLSLTNVSRLYPAMTRPEAPTGQQILQGTIGQGGALSFETRADNVARMTLRKGNTRIETRNATGAGTNKTATFSGKFITGERDFLDGVSFSFDMDRQPEANGTTYRWISTQSITSQRTGVFSGKLTASQTTCNKVSLIWNIQNPSTTTNVNTQGFDLQRRKYAQGGAWSSWENVSAGIIPEFTAQAGGIRKYEVIYELPQNEMNSGDIKYEFRVKRKFADWDDASFAILDKAGNSSNLFQRNVEININTNYRGLSEYAINQGVNNFPRLTWTFGNGVECNDNIKLQLRVGGTTIDIPKDSIINRGYQITAGQGIDPCVAQRYELILQYGNTLPATTYLVSQNYMFTSDVPREFGNFIVSKGYHANRVNLRWILPEGTTGFDVYRIMRKRLHEPDREFIKITEVPHVSNIMQYNFDDTNVEPGASYVYRIDGVFMCGNDEGSKSSRASIGFPQAFGTLKGRITYAGSEAVEGVSLVFSNIDALGAIRELAFSSERLESYVAIPANKKVADNTAFTFQAWVNPLQARDAQYIAYQENRFFISVLNGVNLVVGLDDKTFRIDSVLTLNDYNHISIVARRENTGLRNYEIIVYINGELKSTETLRLDKDLAVSGDTTFLGSNKQRNAATKFNGFMGDIRFWNRILSADEIAKNYDRIISGAETGLVAYYRCNETDDVTGELYDISSNGGVFNSNHAVKGSGVHRRDLHRNATHLMLKGVTDANGFYSIINAIPFTSMGTSYTIVPSFGVHTFEPASRPLFFSPTSQIFNNIDFTNISSFAVSGRVFYEGGNYPVEGVMFEINGAPAVRNNQPIKSDANGEFTINVPIGVHSVRAVKPGHTFLNDGFLTDSDGNNRNYIAPVSGVEFRDTTRVKLIGRVVGGLTEHEKPLGFGESVNNIGVQKIILESTRPQFSFVYGPTSETKTFHHKNDRDGQWTKPDGLAGDSTKVKFGTDTITINVSPETGEFVAWVYPESYIISEIRVPTAEGSRAIYTNRETIDLTTAILDTTVSSMLTNTRTWTDSVFVPAQGAQQEFWRTDTLSDTVRYHAEWTYYWQTIPSFSVTQIGANKQELGFFGDSIYPIGTDTLKLWDGKKYLFGLPVFSMSGSYAFLMTAYEEYVNYAGDEPIRHTYPVINGQVNISNDIAGSEPQTIQLDSITGTAEYTFAAGPPNLTTGQNSFFATLTIGDISYNWDIDVGGARNKPLVAWHLGSRSTGTDFITRGPDKVDFVLRDPPGARSFAYLDEGTTMTHKVSVDLGWTAAWNFGTIINAKPTISITTGAIPGPVTETTTGITQEFVFDGKTSLGLGYDMVYITTFADKFKTSSNPLYVGHQGDVFMGTSTNVLYGMINEITIMKTEDLADKDKEIANAGNFSIAHNDAFDFGLGINTRFAYTTAVVEEMIEKWRESIYSTLKDPAYKPDTTKIKEPVYVSNLERSDHNFGKPGTYTIYFPENWAIIEFNQNTEKVKEGGKDGKKLYGNITHDVIVEYNSHIDNWVKQLKDNEKKKVEAFENDKKDGNFSFGSGSSIEHSKTTNFSNTGRENASFMLAITTNTKTIVDVNGIGSKFESKNTHTINLAEMYSFTHTSTSTTGFVLAADENPVGSNHISVDYKEVGGTFAFKTRGGRTSCPHEPEVRTKYYEPGTVIMKGTMKIENPKIRVESAPQVINVPANRTATFVLALENESETGNTNVLELIVDEKTNPDGAELKIDGLPIGNGRTFVVSAGETMRKTLTVGKGTADKYEKIALILRSKCQVAINDRVYISVEFVPGVSDVEIAEPRQNWILNTNSSTGDTLPVTITGFDANFPGFGYVKLEYRPATSPNWNTIMMFYHDNLYDNAAGSAKQKIDGRSVIVYNWKMPEADGQYEIRATTATVNSENGVIIGEPLSTFTTEHILGFKDMRKPTALGLPSPANGIMGIGDELSITFNKAIQTGMLIKDNFSITGVLNAQEIAEPSAGIAFTGGTQFARTELPIYTGGAFSVEGWFKRDAGTAGTLFAYGNENNSISLGFNAAGNAVVKIGEEEHISDEVLNPANDRNWRYVAMSYDNKNLSIFVFEGTESREGFMKQRFVNTNPPTQGLLVLGNDFKQSNGFGGAVAKVHFYGISRSFADVAATKSLIKSGRERGLIGYWQLDEIEGTIGFDKARARNLVLSAADWYIYPSGHAMKTGENKIFSIPTGIYPLDALSNFTLEFWFRSESNDQRKQVLFSNAQGYIAINSNGGLTLYRNDGTLISVLTNSNLMNTRWYHIAMSVRRGGNVVVFVNGVMTATFPEILLGSFASGDYYFGTDNTTSNYFAGWFDEIRIWNAALTRESINLNRNSKLRGNEAGLLAYYPFETYQKLGNGLIEITKTLANIADTTNTTNATGTAEFSATAAPVKDARPVENVPFSFVASNNAINFTIDPLYFHRVEGTTLTISVKDVRDLRDNKSNTETWTAFIRRNALRWESEPVYLTMEEGETRSFTARITNTGGTTISYVVENVPSWLRVNNGIGNLLPMASRDLTFSVIPGINIGNYETTLNLTNGNNIDEVLSVQLKVSGKHPDWQVNPENFENSMNIVGQIKVNGVFSNNTDDILAAFIGDLCVGTASITRVEGSNAFFVFANIYGNTEHDNKPITFRLWSASTGRIYPKIETSVDTIRFASQTIVGSAANPVIFNALDIHEQTLALRSGWNWISSSIASENPTIIAQMQTGLGSAGIKIKDRTTFVQYEQSTNEWLGTLDSISVKSAYLVNVSRNVSLPIQGTQAAPNTPIAINEGWNWIGYIPQVSLPVKDALAGIEAKVGDIIKGQNSFAEYIGSGVWIGTLTFMQPGSGYMYRSNNKDTIPLIYPSLATQTLMAVSPTSTRNLRKIAPYWTANYSKFPNNMTITAIVVSSGEELRSEQIEIGAFSGSEVRGSTFLQRVEIGGEIKYIGFLVVHGEGNETITFKVRDHADGKIHSTSNEAIRFVANMMHGNLTDRFVIDIGNRVPFDELVSTRFNSAMAVINNASVLMGYEWYRSLFTEYEEWVRYEWYRNDTLVANTQVLNLGANGISKIPDNTRFRVKAISKSGIEVISDTTISPSSSNTRSMESRPELVKIGKKFYAYANMDETLLDGAEIVVYGTAGNVISRVKVSGNKTEINSRLATTGHIFMLVGKNGLNKILRKVAVE